MNADDENSGGRDREMRAWLLFWLRFLVLAAIACFALGFAATGRGPGDYAVGLGLALAAAALALFRLKLSLDGDARECRELMLVDDFSGLALAVPLFTVIGLAGLILAAAWKSGSVYVTGIALFVVSVLIIFLDIKHVFDRSESGNG